MKINVKKFQEGGGMPAPEAGMAPEGGAPAPEAGAAAPGGGQEEMMAQVLQMALQIIQLLGPDAAAALAQMIMEMLLGGGGAPEGAAPEGEPVYRKGGRLAYRQK